MKPCEAAFSWVMLGRAHEGVIFFAKFFWSKGEKCNVACAACVSASGYIWRTVYMHFMRSGGGLLEAVTVL